MVPRRAGAWPVLGWPAQRCALVERRVRQLTALRRHRLCVVRLCVVHQTNTFCARAGTAPRCRLGVAGSRLRPGCARHSNHRVARTLGHAFPVDAAGATLRDAFKSQTMQSAPSAVPPRAPVERPAAAPALSVAFRSSSSFCLSRSTPSCIRCENPTMHTARLRHRRRVGGSSCKRQAAHLALVLLTAVHGRHHRERHPGHRRERRGCPRGHNTRVSVPSSPEGPLHANRSCTTARARGTAAERRRPHSRRALTNSLGATRR